jgi:hypothetical protein
LLSLGTKHRDNRTGKIHDYRRRQNGIKEAWIVGWNNTPRRLWNGAERAEVRKDANTAREIQTRYPEISPTSRRRHSAHKYAEWLHAVYGVAVDAAIHEPGGKTKTDRQLTPTF